VSHTDENTLHRVEHPDGNGAQQTDTSTNHNLQEDIYAYQAALTTGVAEVRIHNDAVHTLTQSVRGTQTCALTSDNDDHHNTSTWFDGVHILDHLTHDHTVINVSVDGNGLPVTTTPTHEHTEQTVLFGTVTATGDDSYVLEFVGQALQGVMAVLPGALLGGFALGLLSGTLVGQAIGLYFWGQMWFGVGQVTWAVAAGYDPQSGRELSDQERIGALGGFVGGLLGSYLGGRVGFGLPKLARNTGLYLAGQRCSIFGNRPCFVAGTPVRDGPDSAKAIEQFRTYEEHGDACDYLLSRSEFGPEAALAPRRVMRRSVQVSPVWNLHADGQVVGTTKEHPFYVRGKGWLAAGFLSIGDEILSSEGTWVRVEGVADSGRVETVYNLYVDEDHTYFVGHPHWGFDLWAHNSHQTPGGNPTPPAGGKPQPPPAAGTPHSQISTGRSQPMNLREQLAMEEAKAGAGKEIIPANKIGDPRFAGGDWAKYQHVHRASDGTKYTIHYMKNLRTGEMVDFKFTNP
jgi:hypothetical protein